MIQSSHNNANNFSMITKLATFLPIMKGFDSIVHVEKGSYYTFFQDKLGYIFKIIIGNV
ncbi:hypothetical protein [Clostridium tagluense]|uniref:hypothetical protein n=1 Tax=Clostridium tagluense TaxID=360422 RepID=UPI001C6F4C22|nr:hypothetical protein [Clostridium tagluense]MBW9158792.1 hypothetical protein [Clostridium tagluense]WLC67409.1 hypothetical protein KTC93_09635 [Clostridium tagluense]